MAAKLCGDGAGAFSETCKPPLAEQLLPVYVHLLCNGRRNGSHLKNINKQKVVLQRLASVAAILNHINETVPEERHALDMLSNLILWACSQMADDMDTEAVYEKQLIALNLVKVNYLQANFPIILTNELIRAQL